MWVRLMSYVGEINELLLIIIVMIMSFFGSISIPFKAQRCNSYKNLSVFMLTC